MLIKIHEHENIVAIPVATTTKIVCDSVNVNKTDYYVQKMTRAYAQRRDWIKYK